MFDLKAPLLVTLWKVFAWDFTQTPEMDKISLVFSSIGFFLRIIYWGETLESKLKGYTYKKFWSKLIIS